MKTSNTFAIKIDQEVWFHQDEIQSVLEKYQDLISEIDSKITIEQGRIYGYLSNQAPFKMLLHNGLVENLVILTKPVSYKRVKLVISYDGTLYAGFQKQKNAKSIGSEIEEALFKIHQRQIKTVQASRTDKGVHAYEQVLHFDTTLDVAPHGWIKYLNHELPKDIHIEDCEYCHPLFHSRYDVQRKTYEYHLGTKTYSPITRNYEWYVGEMNISKLKQGMNELLGTHDFTSFCTGEKESKVRTIFQADVVDSPTGVTLVFTGDGFLHHMIRLIVFQLVLLSKGEYNYTITDLINEKSRKRTTKIAPASGLYLKKIDY